LICQKKIITTTTTIIITTIIIKIKDKNKTQSKIQFSKSDNAENVEVF